MTYSFDRDEIIKYFNFNIHLKRQTGNTKTKLEYFLFNLLTFNISWENWIC